MVICLLSGINAYVLMTSRVLFAMGRDGLFTKRAAQVNEGGTPTFSLFLSTAVALGFLLTGTFNQVINICAFFFVAQQCVSFTSVFVLRWREPNAPRPYRAWGHPITTGIVLLGSIAYLSGVILSDPKTSGISVALLAVSYPVYRLTASLATRGS
jgi:APA family basic amino acid/polyamine antiporter